MILLPMRVVGDSTGDSRTPVFGRSTMAKPGLRSLILMGFVLVFAPGCAIRPIMRSPEARLRDDVEERRLHELRPASPIAQQGSIWTDVATTALAGDTRAARAGDLLTVNIVESTK